MKNIPNFTRLISNMPHIILYPKKFTKDKDRLFVTVHAKTSLVRTKIEINFFTPAYSYIH